jgi:hypothetical protein
MSALSQRCRDRLAKLIPLLGSDADGEVLSASRAIRNVLAAEGRDLHALGDLVRGTPSWGRLSDRERLAWLRALTTEPLLSADDHARMRALQRSGVSRPAKIDVSIFNQWVTRLHSQGVRP